VWGGEKVGGEEEEEGGEDERDGRGGRGRPMKGLRGDDELCGLVAVEEG